MLQLIDEEGKTHFRSKLVNVLSRFGRFEFNSELHTRNATLDITVKLRKVPLHNKDDPNARSTRVLRASLDEYTDAAARCIKPRSNIPFGEVVSGRGGS